MTQPAEVPDEVFRTIAVMSDPEDPDETVKNRTFRMVVAAAYIRGIARGREIEREGKR